MVTVTVPDEAQVSVGWLSTAFPPEVTSSGCGVDGGGGGGCSSIGLTGIDPSGRGGTRSVCRNAVVAAKASMRSSRFVGWTL